MWYYFIGLWNCFIYDHMNPCNQKFLKTETFGGSFCMLHSCSLNVFGFFCFFLTWCNFYLFPCFLNQSKSCWSLKFGYNSHHWLLWSPFMCVALDYQIINIFPILYEDFVGQDYSWVYNSSLTYDCAGMNSVPVGTNQMFTSMPNSATFYFYTLCKDW